MSENGDLPPDLADEVRPNEPDTLIHRVHDGRWEGSLMPGDQLIAVANAGSQLILCGAGEKATIIATRRLWVRIK
eukprot:463084-Lingulodinium_polyedra.AAC.1